MCIVYQSFDLDTLRKTNKWLNDPEIKRLTMSPDITEEDQLKWFNSLNEREDYWIKSIVLEGQAIGVVGLKHIDLDKHTAEYFGYIGEKESWGRGIGKNMMDYAMDYAKNKGINYVYLHVADYNERAFRLYLHKGFENLEKENNVIKMGKLLK